MNQVNIVLFCFLSLILICMTHIIFNVQQINKKLNIESNTFQIIEFDKCLEIYSNGE